VFKNLQLHETNDDQETPESHPQDYYGYLCGLEALPAVGHMIDD
jgi:hypothetical protein